jgi:hypothetical protein
MAVSTRPEMVIFFIVLGFFEKFVKLITSNEINKIIVTKAFNSFNLPHAFHQVIFADYTMLLRVCCVFAASAWLVVCVRGAVLKSAL